MSIRKTIYNGIQVYELSLHDKPIMRRCTDDFVNATHLLSIAGLSKGQRTKALDLYIQESKHYDKVQGGYGRYQGTYIPLSCAKKLAEKYKVTDVLLPILDLCPSDVSYKLELPSPIKKSLKKRKRSREEDGEDQEVFDIAPAAEMYHERIVSPSRSTRRRQAVEEVEEEPKPDPVNISLELKKKILEFKNLDETERQSAIILNIYINGDENELYALLHRQIGLRKLEFLPDMPIDDVENTPLHLATTLGNLEKVSWLLENGADPSVRNKNGETPLIRAVYSLHCQASFYEILDLMQDSVYTTDLSHRTLLHHIILAESSMDANTMLGYLTDTLDWIQENDKIFLKIFINHCDDQGQTAWNLAVNMSETRELLENYGAFATNVE